MMDRKPLSQRSCVLTPAPAPRSRALAHGTPLGRSALSAMMSYASLGETLVSREATIALL